VIERLGVVVPETAVLCSVTGFGVGNRHEQRAGHDVNYLGWAGVLADTAPAMPPTQVADLAAGSLAAALEVVAALLERERTGRGGHVVVSMTHGSHRFVAHRLEGLPERLLTGGSACYRIYATADGRWLTVGALEPKFWQRLCEVVGRPGLAERQFDPDQEAVAAELAEAIAARPLADWLELMDGEDVSAGPVWTIDEAAAEFAGEPAAAPAPGLGEHTEAWRSELGV
jgi:crotonobetainyl-CoA:carnitine CoA-transferase CaiB-like acyl-CoA transferase